jgi:protein involved in polysaccharide export with SLBB domain
MITGFKNSGYRAHLLPCAMVLCLFATALAAQTAPQSTPLLPFSGTRPLDANAESGASDLEDQSMQISLSASQIISILQDKPQVVVELKELMSQTQAGELSTQPDQVSDEVLYNQIATDREFRQKVTMFLRARGYVTDDDLRRRPLPNRNSFDQQSMISADRPLQGVLDMGTNLNPSSGQGLTSDSQSLRNTGMTTRPVAPPVENTERPPIRESGNITTDPPVLRRPAPYNLTSLRDLYTQIPDSPEHLKRFGSEVFTTRAPAVSGLVPFDVPIGPDYVVGPGDNLTIDLWGGVSQSFSRLIAPDGHVSLPEAGDVQVAGLTLGQAQLLVQSALRKQFRDIQVSVVLSRLRTIRIYVVGDVQRPGAYDISSLASALSALSAAGGPTAIGSLRTLKHYRGNKLINALDLYDFLLRGVRNNDDRLQSGDTLAVPAAGPQVAIWGAVRRPAIYELKDETNLAALLADAGGLTVAASLKHITIERIDANQQRETISIGSSDNEQVAISNFGIKDGDRIHVAPIAPYSERVVYLEGHVVRPGRHPYRDGMRLSDILQSYQDLLPEPAAQGEIVRLVPPDLHVQTIDFDVPDVLIGNGNMTLQPFDTIRILGRYDADAPRVEIRGEILRPGIYPLSQRMTASQLVRMAGGFKRDALVETADLISYRVVNGTKVEGQRFDVHIGNAVERDDATADRDLKPGDVLTIHQITGWNDIGASITIEGEVAHPGSYGFKDGERLSEVLRRAGGFRETAYPTGAVLIREQVRELEEKSRAELIRQIESSSAAGTVSPNLTSADPSGQVQLVRQQQELILSRLKSQPATGRLVIHITPAIESWAGTSADIEVRRGDVLRIPKRPGFVLVSGQVYNASAITFTPGKTAGWYLQHAGGSTAAANRKEIFVIRSNGSVVGRRSGVWYDRDVLSTRLEPGDVVVVPQKIIGASMFWRNLLSTAQIASSIAITAAVAGF